MFKKKLCSIAFLLLAIAGCGNDHPPQYQQPQQQVQYAQPAVQAAPVVIQQAAPQQDNSGVAMVAGAALGAMAMHAVNNSDRGYNERYPQQAPQQNITQIHKTTIVNNVQPQSPATPVVSPVVPPSPVTPVTPVVDKVNLAKDIPAVPKATYAAAGTQSPTPVPSQSMLTGAKDMNLKPSLEKQPPKTVTSFNPSLAIPALRPAALAASFQKPMPAPAPKVLALPAPAPKAPSYAVSTYKPAPVSKPTQVDYKVNTYKPTTSSKK